MQERQGGFGRRGIHRQKLSDDCMGAEAATLSVTEKNDAHRPLPAADTTANERGSGDGRNGGGRVGPGSDKGGRDIAPSCMKAEVAEAAAAPRGDGLPQGDAERGVDGEEEGAEPAAETWRRGESGDVTSSVAGGAPETQVPAQARRWRAPKNRRGDPPGAPPPQARA